MQFEIVNWLIMQRTPRRYMNLISILLQAVWNENYELIQVH